MMHVPFTIPNYLPWDHHPGLLVGLVGLVAVLVLELLALLVDLYQQAVLGQQVDL